MRDTNQYKKMKTCTLCRKTKRLESFPRTGEKVPNVPRLHSWCKMCFLVRQRARRRLQKELRSGVGVGKLPVKLVQDKINSLMVSGARHPTDCNRDIFNATNGIQTEQRTH
jgi:hypothetical protein